MRRCFWLLRFALMLVWLAGSTLYVGAQGDISLSTLEVDLWPEYDRPEVLVIYRATLSPAVPLPAELALRIPARAGEPNAVAVLDADGTLRNASYTRQILGEWAVIQFTTTSPEFQLEYYDASMTTQGLTRNYEFRWPGDYAVDFLTIQVQQPLGAREMSLSPAADEAESGADGLVYFTKRVGKLADGQSFSQKFSYQKEDRTLSAEKLQVKPSAPITEAPAANNSLRAAVPWILGILGVLLLVGGGLWYWQSSRANQGTPRPARRRRTATATSAEAHAREEISGGFIYCHQCGKRAGAGDRYCRACGTRLRTQ